MIKIRDCLSAGIQWSCNSKTHHERNAGQLLSSIFQPYKAKTVYSVHDHNVGTTNHTQQALTGHIGITSRELINSEKWWRGPKWLKGSENLWPKLEGFESIESETVELKSSLIVNLTITHGKIIDPDKYSSFLKLLRVTAYIFRFVNALRRKDFEKGPLASEELSNAEIFWMKVTQNDYYSSEITCLKSDKPLQKDSKLLCLDPFLDDNGVLRVTGRLGKTTYYK
ncbi:integrase catalytic domain-containing protein [Trichonephila clavata]|uniref:Integrase catalytic domain-containing protein n=1 Tax=Trichonephila clavata TaxID=2740835 RepID=A0A8X6HRJ7_TRICU|nr:integrase catalytic domain-containing protein [Trichonephila clavata]